MITGKVQSLTRDQAAIIGAYTGFLAGPFSEMQEYADRLLGYETYTHQFGDKAFAETLREAAKADFVALSRSLVPRDPRVSPE